MAYTISAVPLFQLESSYDSSADIISDINSDTTSEVLDDTPNLTVEAFFDPIDSVVDYHFTNYYRPDFQAEITVDGLPGVPGVCSLLNGIKLDWASNPWRELKATEAQATGYADGANRNIWISDHKAFLRKVIKVEEH